MNTVQAPAKELTMLFFRPPILIRPPSQIGKHPPHHKDYADNIIMYYILNRCCYLELIVYALADYVLNFLYKPCCVGFALTKGMLMMFLGPNRDVLTPPMVGNIGSSGRIDFGFAMKMMMVVKVLPWWQIWWNGNAMMMLQAILKQSTHTYKMMTVMTLQANLGNSSSHAFLAVAAQSFIITLPYSRQLH